MRNIAVIDESFDSGITAGCDLLIRFDSHSFASLVLDRSRNLFIAYKNRWFDEPVDYGDMSPQLRKLINSDLHLALPYKSVSFQYVSPVSVLIPSPLYRSDKQESYFRHTSPVPPGSRILSRRIPPADASVVFVMPEEADGVIRFTWPEVQLFHPWCPQVTSALAATAGNPELSLVSVNIGPDHADITVAKGGRLLLQNSYVIRGLNDLMFFILYQYEQFGLQHDETPLFLSGYTQSADGLHEAAAAYIRLVSTVGLPETFQYSPVFRDVPAGWLTDLINMARCA